MKDEDRGAFVMGYLETEVLTEANTDLLIDALLARVPLPWYVPKRFIRTALDRMLPGALLDAFRTLLRQ